MPPLILPAQWGLPHLCVISLCAYTIDSLAMPLHDVPVCGCDAPVAVAFGTTAGDSREFRRPSRVWLLMEEKSSDTGGMHLCSCPHWHPLSTSLTAITVVCNT
jgi:hypothetical protein